MPKARKAKSGPGRPRGPATRALMVRLPLDLWRDLEVLHEILPGEPKYTGIIRSALKDFVAKALQDGRIKADYTQRTRVSLEVLR
jgi:hypothetical protein